jgi:hypothetical protein
MAPGRVSGSVAARAWFAVTALVVAVGLVTQVIAVQDPDGGRFATSAPRTLNIFAFFTIQSNILVGITTGLLALRLDRPAFAFRVLRLTALVSIAVTGVVYHVALSQLRELDGYGALANQLLHTASPILAVVGWLVFGPRGQTSRTVVAWTPVFPVAWAVFTLVRGPFAHPDWYPYPFIDVADKGYLRVFANMVVVAVLYLGFASGAHGLDEWLARRAGRRR